MRFLLTSAGIKNTSINDALVDLLGKPIAESSALCIPTAAYGHPLTPGVAWRFISGQNTNTPMCELGWKSLGVLELTALPSIKKEYWVAAVQEADALLVNGGVGSENGFEGLYNGFSDIQILDALMTPVCGNFITGHSPNFYRISFKKSFIQLTAKAVDEKLLQGLFCFDRK